ncbi:phosphopantetheine-binding protein [Streptomyces specialis]|uniref:phosphopantetheine-binding protein n=1 Tax=Streptomyces specialis TaxID=498367 RepID=UPI00073F0BB9|nr:phosphopantetheine-binding protein [Streptomyces specialis]
MLTSDAIKDTVRREINALLAEAELPTRTLSGDEPLNELSLNSLLLARLVIQLESEFGVDPFEDGDYVISDIRTVDALADAYENTLKATTAAA